MFEAEGVMEPSGDSEEESAGEPNGEPTGAVGGVVGPLPAKLMSTEQNKVNINLA